MAGTRKPVSARALPVPGIEPRGLTFEEFSEGMPQKIGLVGGDMVEDDVEGRRSRRQMMALLLVNTGLAEAVKLAPRYAWLEALERAYGDVN